MRAGVTKEVYVPISNEKLAIIPSNMKGTGFLRNTFIVNKPFIGGLLK